MARTCLQLTVYAAPPDQVARFLDVIEEYELTDNGPYADGRVLLLNHTYLNNNIRCGEWGDMCATLKDQAPGATWEAWEDPAADWLGAYAVFVPSLGEHTAECNADGVTLFTDSEVREFIRRTGEGDNEAVDRDLGGPWKRYIADMAREMPEDLPVPSMRCAECNDEVTTLVGRLCVDCASFAALAREVPAL